MCLKKEGRNEAADEAADVEEGEEGAERQTNKNESRLFVCLLFTLIATVFTYFYNFSDPLKYAEMMALVE